MNMRLRTNERGVALVTALLMSVVIMVMAAGVLYLIIQSTSLSGGGKKYATAAEAADGAVQMAKDTINQVMWGGTPATVLAVTSGTLVDAMTQNSASCTLTGNLPGTGNVNYAATVVITRLYTITIPGGRIEFARSAGGTPSQAVYYRITTKVTGPNNTSAENAALYRFTG